MTTDTFSPLSIVFAADADATMTSALDKGDQLAAEIAQLRELKRSLDASIHGRELEITNEQLTLLAAEKTNAEARQATIRLAIARDPQLLRERGRLHRTQEDLDRAEMQWELAMKRWHGAARALEYATAVANLYAGGGQLHV